MKLHNMSHVQSLNKKNGQYDTCLRDKNAKTGRKSLLEQELIYGMQ